MKRFFLTSVLYLLVGVTGMLSLEVKANPNKILAKGSTKKSPGIVDGKKSGQATDTKKSGSTDPKKSGDPKAGGGTGASAKAGDVSATGGNGGNASGKGATGGNGGDAIAVSGNNNTVINGNNNTVIGTVVNNNITVTGKGKGRGSSTGKGSSAAGGILGNMLGSLGSASGGGSSGGQSMGTGDAGSSSPPSSQVQALSASQDATPLSAAPAQGDEGEREESFNRRFLKVKNDSDVAIKVFVQYRVLDDKKWAWLPADPNQSKDAATFELQPGQEMYPQVNGQKVAASRVRVWATAAAQTWLDYRDQDLWVVPEMDQQGEHRYVASEMKTFTFVFPKITQ